MIYAYNPALDTLKRRPGGLGPILGERAEKALPPEPRLQGVPGHVSDPQQDLRDKIAADTEANESIGWVDKANGIAKIPVKDAMEIIAEKAGAAPSGGTEKKK